MQDRPWETRIDNGYPNVVYDPAYAGNSTGESGTGGPWRLWYGNLGEGGQYLLYADSTDGLAWNKPDLGRYDLGPNWAKNRPDVAKFGKHNNIVLFGGGLGIYREESSPLSPLRETEGL